MKNAFYSELLDKYFLSEEELNTEEAKVKEVELKKLQAEEEKNRAIEVLKELYARELVAKDEYTSAANKFNTAKSEFVKKYGYIRLMLTDKDGKKDLSVSTDWEAPKLTSSSFLDDMFNWLD